MTGIEDIVVGKKRSLDEQTLSKHICKNKKYHNEKVLMQITSALRKIFRLKLKDKGIA